MTRDSEDWLTRDEASDRRAAPLRFLVVAAAVMAAATLIARFGMGAIERSARGLPDEIGSGPKRLARFVEVLPAMARRPDDTAVILGSSLAYFGVALDTFDARMGELGVPVSTLTAATPMVTPTVELAIARKVARVFARAHHQIELVLVEMTPQGLTAASARMGGGFHRVPLGELAAVGDARSIAELALEAPDDAAHVVGMAALGNQDPETLEDVVGRRLFEGDEHGEDAAPIVLHRALVRRFGVDAATWNSAARGEPRWLTPESQLPYMLIIRGAMEKKVREHDEMVEHLVAWNDARELRFDEQRVREFIRVVQTVRSFAHHTVVWIAPRNPEFNDPTPAARERLAELVSRVKHEGRAPLVDLGTMPDVGPADFFDGQHVTEHGGRPKVSRALAEAVARIVNGEDQSVSDEDAETSDP